MSWLGSGLWVILELFYYKAELGALLPPLALDVMIG
jgi:hypothetical protein